jgi:hypothetical protein
MLPCYSKQTVRKVLKLHHKVFASLNSLPALNFVTARLNAKRPMDRDAEFQRLCREAGVEYPNPHAHRYVVAGLLAELGMPQACAGALLGRNSKVVARVYEAYTKHAVASFPNCLSQIGGWR